MGSDIAVIVLVLLLVALFVFLIACMWTIFTKAGQPGVAAIVPIWNNYVLTCGVAKKEVLWFILQFIPFINIVVGILVWAEVAKKFGYSGAFVVGIIFLPFIFIPILAFGGVYEDNTRRRKRSDYRDDYEDDDRPRRDDDEEDDRPRRRKARRDDD